MIKPTNARKSFEIDDQTHSDHVGVNRLLKELLTLKFEMSIDNIKSVISSTTRSYIEMFREGWVEWRIDENGNVDVVVQRDDWGIE